MKSIPASADRPVWSVGDLAARFGLETHVLRHWESMGLLNPARDGAAAGTVPTTRSASPRSCAARPRA